MRYKKTLVRYKLEYVAPVWHPNVKTKTQITNLEKMQRTAARWACRKWRNTITVGDLLDDFDWQALEVRRGKISLTFFYKIHMDTGSIDKDIYLTRTPLLRQTRTPNNSQCHRYPGYTDALKTSFFPRAIPHWNSLPSSVVVCPKYRRAHALI